MKKTKPSLEEYFELPNPGLRAYFKHTIEGNPDDYRPPFWSGYSREEVLAMWQKRLDATGVQTENPTLYEYELDMKSKVGPMSVQAPLNERIESIEAYFADVLAKSEAIDERAINNAIAFFKRAGGIRIKSLANTVCGMRLSTNSGNPWFTKRRNVVDDVLSSHIFRDKGKWKVCYYHNGSYREFHLSAILGWRGQEGGIKEEDVKQRVIWMMSMALNAHELRFYQSAIAAMQKYQLIPAYVSMDAVDREVTELFRTKKPNDDVICTDFSRFDQHFNRDMQSAAAQIEQSLLCRDFADNDEHARLFPVKFELPIICSQDLMYEGPHGMGSGSGGTNFDECMAHKALQFEAALNAKQPLNPHSMAYGDDGILSYPGCNVEDVIGTYSRHGQEMNPTKQYVSKHDCVVLRRWHGEGYRVNGIMVGVYSTFRALGRLLAQERFYDPDKWSKEMVTLRALSIIENCKWSPYFREFVMFCMEGDKYRLGLGLSGFFENLEKTARKAIDEFEDFLGYTKNLQDNGQRDAASGINDWEVVKLLRTLR